jgi:hypothetical protein
LLQKKETTKIKALLGKKDSKTLIEKAKKDIRKKTISKAAMAGF